MASKQALHLSELSNPLWVLLGSSVEKMKAFSALVPSSRIGSLLPPGSHYVVPGSYFLGAEIRVFFFFVHFALG
jgi:hypothetical protein